MNQINPKKINTIGILVNPRKEKVVKYLKDINSWIENVEYQTNFLLCTYNSKHISQTFLNISHVSEKELLKRSDIIITLGGDGTILKAVHSIGNLSVPILGVNLGGLGFLADTPPENMIKNIESCLKGNYFIEDRSILRCKIKENQDTFFAFNDIVIDKSGFSRVIEIVTHIDNNLLNYYIADGIILSTPTGSTAYSLSAGGPIVVPQTNVFIINPICPHSLTNRPVVVTDNSIVTLDVFTEYKEINIYRDGQFFQSCPSGTSFEISKADFQARLVKMKEMSFYNTLRNKLHWGEDFRDKKRWLSNDKVK